MLIEQICEDCNHSCKGDNDELLVRQWRINSPREKISTRIPPAYNAQSLINSLLNNQSAPLSYEFGTT
jgi:hypothetical protein